MEVRTGKVMLGAILAVLVAGCAGPEGEQGPKGDPGREGQKGDSGPGYEVGRSISAVQPSWALRGRLTEVQISGYATDWATGLAPTVDLGPGIEVLSVRVASNSALFAKILSWDDAEFGPRDVKVTGGDETLTFSGGFTIRRPLEAVVHGQLARPGLATIEVIRYDPSIDFEKFDDFSVDKPSFLQIEPNSVDGGSLHIIVLASPTADPGTHEVMLRFEEEGRTSHELVVPVTVSDAPVPEVTSGTFEGTLRPYESRTWRYIAPSAGQTLFEISRKAGQAPLLVLMDSEGEVFGSGQDGLYDLEAGDVIYLLPYALRGESGSFELSLSRPPLFTESEPNDTIGEADAAAGERFFFVGSVSASDRVDYVLVDAKTALAGRRVEVKHIGRGNEADFTVEVLSPDGETTFGKSGNLYTDKQFTSSPLTGGTSYLLKISYDGYNGDVNILVSLK